MVPPAAPELAPVVSPMRRAARRHCGSERALGAHDSNTLRPRIDPQGGELTFDPGTTIWILRSGAALVVGAFASGWRDTCEFGRAKEGTT